MASVHLDQNGDHYDNPHAENFGEAEVSPQIPIDSYDAVDDTFGDPEIPPRIGDEYQVEIPPITGNAETGPHPYQHFLTGLPILLTWISSIKQDSKNVIKMETLCMCNGQDRFLVPGLSDEYWSAAETDSFLLGLYIFEKNFVEVRRFVGTKGMGALLSFYYGKFYGSQEYRRWSECRKMKSKKGAYGRRLFLGLRQQELLSRILPRVSEECRNALLEVSKIFADEKMSLADYISSLKAMVGMNILVEVVGIGTGKQDLTTMALEAPKSNHVAPTRPEIPTGKACASLTTSEIIGFLSGDYRLSKARSNDLFWEAVWPRLLARGWHSEQPKNQGYIKNCLVFLMPGVKKFSRRKLVKGDHYFDSVTDVLSKVTKEPGLIELENELDDGSKNKEQDDNGSPARQKHCYLQPRTPKKSKVVMKFTVVDTGLPGGKVREFRSLPSEISSAFLVQDCSEDSSDGDDTSEETSDEADTTDTVTDTVTVKSDEKILPDGKDHKVNALYGDNHGVYPYVSATLVPDSKNEEGLPEKNQARNNEEEFVEKKNKEDLQDYDRSRKSKADLQEQDLSRNKKGDSQEKNRSRKNKADLQQKNHQSRKVPTSPLSREPKQGNVDHMGPTTKRCRMLTTSDRDETNVGFLANGMPSCCSGTHEVADNLSSQAGLSRDRSSSTTSSSRGSPGETVENPQTQTLIDLNLPQILPDSENGVVFTTKSSNEQDSASIKNHFPPKFSTAEANLNPRRHSTRNRPPTTRALEALANGYLTVNRRRKVKDNNAPEDLASRPSQRPRVVVEHNESTNSSHVDQEAENFVSKSGNSVMFDKSQVQPEGNVESVSGR